MRRAVHGAALCAALAGCATLHGVGGGRAGVAGQWIDLHALTPADTAVWLLAPNGDDGLLRIHVDADGRRETRRHYGRWRVGTAAHGGTGTLCFIQRPGRDAPSCVPYALDTVTSDGGLTRRLRLFGYVGEHHTGDRTLLERRVVARPGASAPSGAPPVPGGGSSGLAHPRAVQPERPSVATHAGTVAPGFAELETGVEHDRLDDGTRALGVPTVLKLGVGHNVQLSLGLPASSATGVPFGAGDLSLGLKWRPIEDRPLLQDVAVLPSVKFATGGLRGTGTTDASLLLIDSRTLGPVGLDLNVGATWHGGGTAGPRWSTLWTVSAGIPLRGALGWALECYGYPGTAGPVGDAPVVALLTGPTLVVHPALALDAGLIAPLAGLQPHALYVGAVTNLGRFAPRRR